MRQREITFRFTSIPSLAQVHLPFFFLSQPSFFTVYLYFPSYFYPHHTPLIRLFQFNLGSLNGIAAYNVMLGNHRDYGTYIRMI